MIQSSQGHTCVLLIRGGIAFSFKSSQVEYTRGCSQSLDRSIEEHVSAPNTTQHNTTNSHLLANDWHVRTQQRHNANLALIHQEQLK